MSMEETSLRLISCFFDTHQDQEKFHLLCKQFIDSFDTNTALIVDNILLNIYNFQQLPAYTGTDDEIIVCYTIFNQLIERRIQDLVFSQFTIAQKICLLSTQIYITDKYQQHNASYYCQSIINEIVDDENDYDFTNDLDCLIIIFVSQHIPYVQENLAILLIEAFSSGTLNIQIQASRILLHRQLIDQDLKAYSYQIIQSICQIQSKLDTEKLMFLIQFQQDILILLHICIELQSQIDGKYFEEIANCLKFSLLFSVNNQYEEQLCIIFSIACLVMRQISQQNDMLFISQKDTLFYELFSSLLEKVDYIYQQKSFKTETKQYLQNFVNQYLTFVDYLNQYKINLPFALNHVSEFDIPDSLSYCDQIKQQKISNMLNEDKVYDRQEKRQHIVPYQSNSGVKIKQLENKILTTSFGQNLEQQLEFCKLIINLDELLPEYGQVIQYYSKSELPSSIINLIVSLFTIQPLNNFQEKYDIIVHPGLISCLSILYRFRKQSQTLKTLQLMGLEFWNVVNLILNWFHEFYIQEESSIDYNYGQFNQTFLMLISILNRVIVYSGSILIQKIIQIPFFENLVNLLSIQHIFLNDNDSSIKISNIINQILNFSLKFGYNMENQVMINFISQIDKNQFYESLNNSLDFYLNNDQINPVIQQQMLVIICQIISKYIYLFQNAAKFFILNPQNLLVLYNDYALHQTKEIIIKQTNKEIIYDQDLIFSISSVFGCIMYKNQYLQTDLVFQSILSDLQYQQILVKKLLSSPFSQNIDISFYLLFAVYQMENLIKNYSINNESISSLLDNYFLILFTQANYNIKIYDLLFVWSVIYNFLSTSIFGKFFLSKLFLVSFKGCQPRKEKRLQFIDQTVDFKKYRNLSLESVAEEVCGNLFTLNSRTDMDLTRQTFLLQLSNYVDDQELCFLMVVDDSIQLYQILQSVGIVKSFLTNPIYQQFLYLNKDQIQKESTNTIFEIGRHNYQISSYIVTTLTENVKCAPISMCISHLVLIFADIIFTAISQSVYTFSYKLLYSEFMEFGCFISQTWQIKKEIIYKQQQADNLNKIIILQQLYPNTNLQSLFKQKIDGYFDPCYQFQMLYKIFYKQYTQQFQKITVFNNHVAKNKKQQWGAILQALPSIEFLIISNILFISFEELQELDFIVVLQNNSFYSIISMFQFSQIVQSKLQACIQIDNQDIENWMYKMLSNQQQLNDQFENCYNNIVQVVKSIQVYLRQLNIKQSIQQKNVKQFELLFYLSILQNPYSNEDIFEDAIKQTQQDFVHINFKYDNLLLYRQQRQNYNVAQIHKSQLKKIYLYDQQFMLDQESQISQQYIIVFSEIFGIELFIRFISQQITSSDESLQITLIQQATLFINKVKYKPKYNDTLLDSIFLTKQLIQLSIETENLQFKLDIFKFLILFNSFNLDSHSTLLFLNGYLSYIQDQVQLKNKQELIEVVFDYHNSLTLLFRKIQESYKKQKNNKFRYKQQQQVIKNDFQNPLLSTLYLIDDSLQQQQAQVSNIELTYNSQKFDQSNIFIQFIKQITSYFIDLIAEQQIKLIQKPFNQLILIDQQIHYFCEKITAKILYEFQSDIDESIQLYYDLLASMLVSINKYCVRNKIDTIQDDQLLFQTANDIIQGFIAKSQKFYKPQYAQNLIEIICNNKCHLVQFQEFEYQNQTQDNLIKLLNDGIKFFDEAQIQHLYADNSQFIVKIRKGWRGIVVFVEVR